VKAVHGQELEVEWLVPPAEIECGREAEYLSTAVGDDALTADLPATSALPAESHDRPSPHPSADEAIWQQRLAAANTLSGRFAEIRAAAPDIFASAATPPEDGAKAGQALSSIKGELAARREDMGKELRELEELSDAFARAALAASEGAGAEAPDNREAKKPRKAELLSEREALLERLRALDEELATLGGESSEVDEAAAAAASAASAADRRRRLVETIAASQDVDALLDTRLKQVEEWKTAAAPDIPSALAKTCLEAEMLRRRQFEELVGGLHLAVWGSDAGVSAKDPAWLTSVRGVINRAGGAIEHSWRETVQLAAETLGDSGPCGLRSEDMSRAAKRYKEMRGELQEFLTRLAKLEGH